MANPRRLPCPKLAMMILATIAALAVWLLLPRGLDRSQGRTASPSAVRQASGSPRLVSVEPLPVLPGEMCQWVPAGASSSLAAGLREQRALPGGEESATTGSTVASREVDLAPVRVLNDDAPTYSAVAVDSAHNEIVLQDENLYQILVYDRLANTPPTATMTEPKRILGGSKTKIEFNCGLYVDPKTGDIYSVNNDTMDTLVIFSREARGNVPPTRELHTPHGTYGIAVDEVHQEMFLTIEHDSAVVAYSKTAQGSAPPLRLIQGDRTLLADPHGIAVDPTRNWLFVANHGSTHQVADNPKRDDPPNWPLTRSYSVPGSGETWAPSITVYERTAQGNAAPLRVLEGPKTQLNWPAQLFLDPERGELYVANDGGDSVLVFRAADQGDVAPLRVIQGPRTGLKNPTGVWVDTKNNEVVVSNMGNHTATIYPRTANGNAAPLRTIRGAPLGKQALAIGNPGGIAYDSKRDEILVPN